MLDDEHQSDGGDDRCFGIIVDASEQQTLGEECQDPDGGGSDDQGSEETGKRTARNHFRRPPGEHRAQHEEFAVSNIDDTHDAED